MRQMKMAALAAAALLTLIVVFQNTEPVQTRLLFFTFTAPAALLLFGVGMVGFLLGVAAALFAGRSRRDGARRREPDGP